MSAPVRPLPRPADADRLAKVLSARLRDAYASLPEHERLAAVAAVQDTFAADELTADRLFAADLDPDHLRAELHRWCRNSPGAPRTCTRSCPA